MGSNMRVINKVKVIPMKQLDKTIGKSLDII